MAQSVVSRKGTPANIIWIHSLSVSLTCIIDAVEEWSVESHTLILCLGFEEPVEERESVG